MLHFFWTGYNLSENSYSTYEIANCEIAKWAEKYLGQKVAFHQSIMTAGRVTDNPDDILMGHLTWDSRPVQVREQYGPLIHNWVKDNALSPDQPCHPNTYILFPWVPEFPREWIANMPFWHDQLRSAPKIFALCGDFWINRTKELTDDSIQKEVSGKLIHSNMGVAASNLQIIKKRFNKVGERHILHMSNLGSYKGFDITCKSLQGLPIQLHVATSSINAPRGPVKLIIDNQEYVIDYLGYVDNNDQVFNQWVADTCDFYIHTGTMDAQATVILENCARGLIPMVTPESGFASRYAINLTHDPIENRKIIQQALELPEEELLLRSMLLRKQIIREHSWEGIFNKIWNEIETDIKGRK